LKYIARRMHKTDEKLCKECKELLEYANLCLIKCPFQKNEPVCSKCHIHGYKNSMREKNREVMKYSCPRIFARHPVLAAFHFIDRIRKDYE